MDIILILDQLALFVQQHVEIAQVQLIVWIVLLDINLIVLFASASTVLPAAAYFLITALIAKQQYLSHALCARLAFIYFYQEEFANPALSVV